MVELGDVARQVEDAFPTPSGARGRSKGLALAPAGRGGLGLIAPLALAAAVGVGALCGPSVSGAAAPARADQATGEPYPHRLEVVGQSGGASLAVVADSGSVYLGVGPRVAVLDARGGGAPTRVAQTEVLPGVVRALAYDRDHLFAVVAADPSQGRGSLLVVLSVAEPARPVLLSTLERPYEHIAVVVSGDLALLVGRDPGLVDGEDYWGFNGVLELVDVRDRAAPAVVGRQLLWDWPVAATAGGGHAYVLADAPFIYGDSARVLAFEIGAGRLRQVAAHPLPAPPLDIAFAGGRVLVAGGEVGLWLLDDAGAGLPELLRMAPRDDGWCAGRVHADGSLVAVVDDCSRRLRLIHAPPTGVPVEVGSVPLADTAADVCLDGDGAYVAAGRAGGLEAFRLRSDGVPSPAGTFEEAGALHRVVERAGVVYGAHSAFGVSARAWDGAGRALPLLGEVRLAGTRDIALAGEYLYAAGGNPGEIAVLALAADGRPERVAGAPVDGEPVDLEPGGRVLFAASMTRGVLALGLADPLRPTEIGFEASTDASSSVGLALSGRLLHSSNGHWVRTVVASEPRFMYNVAMVECGGDGMAVDGDLLYCAHSNALAVFDYADAEAPRQVGTTRVLEGLPDARALERLGEHLVWVGWERVALVERDRVGGFLQVAGWESLGAAYDVEARPGADGALVGSLLFVADGDAGLVVLEVVDAAAPTAPPSRQPPTAATRQATAAPEASATPRWGPPAWLPVVQRSGRTGRGMELEFAGELGGGARGVDVAGDIAWRGEGPHLVALDIGKPEAIHEIGRSDPLPGVVIGVDVVGDVAYVAAGDAGLVAVDVSDPRAPRFVATAGTAGMAFDVAVTGEMAVVAVRDVGLLVLDAADPHRMREVGRLELARRIDRVELGPGLALVGSDPLLVVDLANPAQPAIVAEIPGGPSVAVSGTLAFVAEDGLAVWDLSAGKTPRLLSRTAWESPGPSWYPALAADGSRLFVLDGEKLAAYDVRDPTAPIRSGETEHACEVLGLALEGDRLVLTGTLWDADWPTTTGPLSVFEVVEPARPRLAGEYWQVWAEPGNPLGEAQRVGPWAVGRYLWAPMWALTASDRRAATYRPVTALIDPGDPSRMRLVGLLEEPVGLTDLVVRGGTAWALTDSGALSSYEVSDPARPALLGSVSIGGDWRLLEMVGSIAYVLAADRPARADDDVTSRLVLVDASDPRAPRIVSRLQLPRLCTSAALHAPALYLGCHGGDDSAPSLLVVDARDPAAPVIGAGAETELPPTSLAVGEGHLFAADRYGGVTVYALGDPLLPRPVTAFDTHPIRYRRAVRYEDRRLYVAGYGGLVVLDVRRPERPAVLERLDLRPGEWRWRDPHTFIGPIEPDRVYLVDASGPTMVLQAFRLRLR